MPCSVLGGGRMRSRVHRTHRLKPLSPCCFPFYGLDFPLYPNSVYFLAFKAHIHPAADRGPVFSFFYVPTLALTSILLFSNYSFPEGVPSPVSSKACKDFSIRLFFPADDRDRPT